MAQPTTLQDDIDIAFADVVDGLREKYVGVFGAAVFSGMMAGMLLKTAIRLAKEGGCPPHILRESVLASIRDEYAGGTSAAPLASK